MNSVAKRGLKLLLLWQCALTFLLMILFYILYGIQGATSALLGGMVCSLPNLYFAIKFFRYSGARQAHKIVQAFYKGEAIKLLITVALFALIFKLVTLKALAFFVSFIMVQGLFWIAPWLFVNKRSE